MFGVCLPPSSLEGFEPFWFVGVVLVGGFCCGIVELGGGLRVTNPTLRGGCWMLGVHPSLSSLATGGFIRVLWFGGLLGRFRCGTLVFRGGCKVTKPTLRACCVDATVSCSAVEVLAVLGFTFEACV